MRLVTIGAVSAEVHVAQKSERERVRFVHIPALDALRSVLTLYLISTRWMLFRSKT